MWLKVDDFKGLLRGWWQGIEARGRASFRLVYKMKVVKQNIKVWNREVFGRVEVNKNSALQQLEYWDGVESERSLSIAEAEQKKEAKDAFHKWVLMEEIHWRQKSRELWLKEGDRNTGYFHRMANAHRRNNSLDRITINGEMLTEDQEVREGIVNAFQNLLSEEPGWRADIEGLQLKHLNPREAENLEVPFSEEEIHFALMEMRGDKAPGPDGFTVAFWQDCWDLVKEEVMDLFKEFFEYGSFAKSLNTTFLVLIPKKGGADDLGDFRPISLLGSLYKLLAKVLANRLKKVLDRVVSVDQNAFVRGRQILDASLVANEVIDYWYKRKEKGLICKLDIEKAYDSINWNFLMKVLRKMGFGSRWMDWMRWCISTAKFSILINGVPVGFFSNSKGLRQGDPLFPYLFVLGMEVLSTMIRRAGEGGFISCCRMQGREGEELTVSHLLFADDTLIFCKARREQLSNLSWILAWFEAASGLRINLAKSVLIPVGEVDEMEELAAELEGKVHLINWQVVCSPKEEGGLGIRKIDLLNKTLLGKWVWRYAYEKENLWKKAIGVKYGQEGCGWRTKEVCGPYGVGLWKEIMKEVDWCWESMDLKVGKGNRVLFWMDKWCGNEALSQSFPQLFTLAGHKNAKVCEVWDSSLGQGGWNLSLARDFNDWEIDQIGEMLNLLKDFKISQEEDLVRWKREGNGVFGAKGAYKSLSGYSIGAFPNRRIWMDKVPTKVSFFAWEAAWGKILTLDKLQKRGWQLPNRCNLCGCEEENANHILLHCTVVKTIWEITLVIFGVQWVFPESVIEVLLSWRGSFVGKKRKKIWKSIPLCIFWTVWKERNRIVFRGGSLDIQKFKYYFVCNLWSWAKVYIGEESHSLLGFLEWLGTT
ncbi:LINE-1 reverse transcriptase-like [Vitis vinifera]|uniref:LINE-1 reverse transcriptase-like n=1 Tax=Vitis vinifera TaxID=29760 RepID=A0A438CGA5_VITVI|nr:LINE-1 reverse transcriptase-like [Vitis vinifera]